MAWIAPAIGAVGAIAGGLASRGGSADIDYDWSPQQEQWFNRAYPFMGGIADYGISKQKGPFMGAPMMGQAPSMYNLPNINQMMPNQGWYNNLDDSIKAGIREPWEDASDQMMANMSGIGQFGSPSGGISGAALNAQGSLWADAGQQMGGQAWNMISPALQRGYQDELSRNIADYSSRMLPWQENYNRQVEAWRKPFESIPSSVMGTMPTGIINQQGNPFAGALSGGLSGLMAGYGMYGSGQQGGGGMGMGAGYIPYQYTQGQPNMSGRPIDQWQY